MHYLVKKVVKSLLHIKSILFRAFFSTYNGKKILCEKKKINVVFELHALVLKESMCEKISQTKQNKQAPSEWIHQQ